MRGDAVGLGQNAKIRVPELYLVGVAEKRPLEKSDDAVGVVIHQQDLHRLIVLRQRSQLVRGVLEAAVSGNADNASGPPRTGCSYGRRQRVSHSRQPVGHEERLRMK